MAPHHPASETAGQRAQAHDADDNPFDSTVAESEKPSSSSSSSKQQSDPTNKENVIRFAPLSIPRSRRLQTLGVLFWALLLPICLSIFFLLLSVPLTWPILIPYLIWIFFIDNAPENGGRRFSWVRKLPVFRYFAEYFPISMIKTTNLPPDRPYIFGYHPHGILGVAAVANLATDATEFPSSFPGITPHLLTLATNFTIPLFRDCLMAMGICSVSKRSCEAILKKGKGSAIAIVVGGASESLAAHPGTADLTLKRRLGFIKIAIRNGADLVPVFSFGENDVYEQLSNEEGTKIFALQKKFQAVFGFTLPFFHGRGLFNYSIGLMPYRHPIVSVVGKPIHVKQNPNPSKEEIEEVQNRYIEELMNIWETWKDAYAANRTKELTIVA
ncbi:probable diacylglycerol acyltransferase type 2b [Ustilago trichophora]|uniref:Diacylglycerol O-acyltransferase n=1 Tax=Ustilago trichophora TaxID=86804 RepID=A0A5C3EDR9_9BASI|nr:probable diacylglycerol acyltransferase type 2b [Ustilago trichophora]